MSKTTDKQRINMVKMYKSGISTIKIGKKFGTSPANVYGIIKRRGVKIRSRSEANRKYVINEYFFDKIDSENKSYFLGFLFADGCNILDRFEVSIGLAKYDKEILEKLNKLVYIDRPLWERPNRFILVIVNKHISQQLDRLGCMPRKTLKLKYPHYLPPELHRHFIRGFFDGDGSIYKRKNGQFCLSITSTEHICEGIQQIIFEHTSISPHIRKRGNTYELEQGGNMKVKCITDWLYNNATISMKRKYDKYLQLVDYYEQRYSLRHTNL